MHVPTMEVMLTFVALACNPSQLARPGKRGASSDGSSGKYGNGSDSELDGDKEDRARK